MSASDNGSAPAYPTPRIRNLDGLVDAWETEGITKRERAAIDLRIPNSGSDWLDDMIREANRRDAAVEICAGLCIGYFDENYHAQGAVETSVEIADALLAALSKEKTDGV